MKRNLFLTLIASLLAMGVSFAQPVPRKGVPAKGVVRIKLQRSLVTNLPDAIMTGKVLAETSEASENTEASENSEGSSVKPLQVGIKPLDASLRKIGGRKMRKVFPCAPSRETEHRKFGLDQWYEITFDESISPLEARNILKQTAGIETAVVKVPMKMYDDCTFTKADAGRAQGTSMQAQQGRAGALPFNDPRLAQQWHYNNDGSMNGSVPGADINLFKAWQISTGSSKVIVAIIDGGIETSHEDLAAHIWVNQAELNGKPDVDDDGNGYIDDVYGYNFCTNNASLYPHSHGTHVAGTVGAINNNGTGVCGVAGGDGSPNSGVRMMSCQVFDNRVDDGDFAAALIYAADMGATIAQCSWGWADEDYYEQDVLDAVRYFTKTARSNNMTGGLCIFASGNEGMNGRYYPGCMDEVLSVAAMNYDLTPSFYSNHGSWVDVTAPGGDTDFDQAQGVLSTLPGNTYGYSHGTSMAAPHVSGIAALVLSKYGSPNLTNESLRQQIITSVNDLYSRNEKAEGLFGSGYVDAYKAMQWGDGTAPSPVTDLVAIAMQESASLSWTIPASSSNNVNSHVLYYSTKPITEETLGDCKTIVLDTKFYNSGDKFVYELENLDALTTYYIALKAVDRWGNSSPLSTVVTITTNAGPKMTLSRTSMALNSTDGVTWPTRTFDIGNADEGLLKWSIKTRTATSAIRAYDANDHKDSNSLKTSPLKGKPVVMPMASSEKKAVLRDVADFSQEDFPQEIKTHTGIFAYIGDNELPNSMAQLFVVDKEQYPDGFHLTHIWMDGYNGVHPIFEVHRNAAIINEASLIERYDAGEGAVPYGYDHALPEALYFAPGESFYIVVHFEGYENRNYPLGLAYGDGSATASRAYMSNDKGQTWTLLSTILVGTSYEFMAEKGTWCITAKSKFPDWSKVLEITPTSGQLKQGETQTVSVTHNGTPIPNGNYRARILFDTNEREKNSQVVTATLNVSGQAPDVSFNKVVEFGTLLVGQKKTVTVEVFNKGYGAFAGGETYAGIFKSNISCTSDQFQGPEYVSDGIPARSFARIDLIYAPTEAGNHAGVIILKDKDGRELRFNVTGAATEPAKITVTPESIEVGDLNADKTEKTVNFTITNDGKYPLQYVMPKFSTETFDNLVSNSSTHRYGYAYQSNLYSSEEVKYEGAPQLVGATNIASQFGDYQYFSEPIDIGFKFPFYDKFYDKIYISSLGTLSFKPYLEGTIYSPLTEESVYMEGLGVISAYGQEFQVSPKTRIEYARQDGKFIVNFKDVLVTVYDTETMPASFHIALSPSGDIEIGFDDYTAAMVFEQGSNLWVGIVDPDEADPLTVTSAEWTTDAFWYDDPAEHKNRWRYVNTGSVFKFYAPKPNMIASIAPSAGIVSPGDKQTVTAIVKASDDMVAGPTYTDLVIQSNDLKTPTKLVRFNANVVGDLKPLFELGCDKVDFGEAFRTSKPEYSVSVLNNGRDKMTLQGVSITGKFAHNFTSAVEIPASQSKDIIVTMQTEDEGELSGTLTVTTSAGEKTIELKGKVIGVPDIKLGYESVKTTLASGKRLSKMLNITNTGNEPLVYSIVAGNHVSYTPNVSTGASTHYEYVASLDDPAAARDWVDIETNGLGKQYNYTNFLTKDIVEVNLPFDFPFYGQRYRKMYIYDSGFVSFTPRKDEGVWPEPPTDFPAGSYYTNIIAPYWGLHTMDISNTAGIYHYEDDEQAVVSFIEYGNSMNLGVDFQVILRKDGTFTFNYKKAYSNAILFGLFGVAGIVDPDGGGINMPSRYVDFGSSVTFSPIVENTVQPGKSAIANIAIVGDDLAGEYNTKITVNTNIPTKPVVDIPVNLTITGEPAALFPEDITVENVAEFVNADYHDEVVTTLGAMWYIPLEVSNKGTAPFTITGIDVESPMMEGNPLFKLYWYGKYTDPWTGSTVEGWCPYSGGHATVGRSAVKFILPLTSNDYSFYAWQTPGEYPIKLTFHISGIEGVTTKTVNVFCRITDQPTIAVSQDEIRVMAPTDDYVGDETLTISNAEGKYALKYTVKVDPTGIGEKVDNSGGIVPMSVGKIAQTSQSLQSSPSNLGRISPMAVGKSDFMYDCPDEEMAFDYNRALYWPALQSSTMAWNYGTTTTYGVYKAATAFTGPEGGFNISHIYFALHPYNLDYKDVEIEIYNGDPQRTDEVIGHGTFHIGKVETQLYENIRTVVALDKPVYISEGQEFYVVITFPTGQEYPASLVKKEEGHISNRYLGYWDNYGWFDVAAIFLSNYGSLGYMCSCLETTEGDAWVKVLDPATGNPASTISGEIPAGQTADIKVHISAAGAPKETDNKAMLVIKSNDPKTSVINFPVYLDKNSSPAITIGGSNLLVKEGETLTVPVTVLDKDGDSFTVTLEGVDFATFSNGRTSYLNLGGGSEANLNIVLAPGYDTAGSYTLAVTAVDKGGHINIVPVLITVAKVNRAPEPVPFPGQNFALQTNTISQVIDLTTLFADPDDDLLTFDVTLRETTKDGGKQSTVKMFRADNEVFFKGVKEGWCIVDVVATDPAGATCLNSFGITIVDDINAIDFPTYKGLDVINVTIYNTAGQVVGNSLETPLPSGTYIFRIVTVDGVKEIKRTIAE